MCTTVASSSPSRFVRSSSPPDRTLPRGNANLANQLSRSSVSTVTNIAEGANRLGTGEKRQKFSIARGEVGEAAACIELAAALGLVPRPEAEAALVLAGRIAAMLTRLIQRC